MKWNEILKLKEVKLNKIKGNRIIKKIKIKYRWNK